MAAMTFTVEVPDHVSLDHKTLQEQLSAFARILISYSQSVKKEDKKEDMHIFDCFSGNWGGERDSHEIADELFEGRDDARTIETW